MLTDFQNSFADRLTSKFATNSVNIWESYGQEFNLLIKTFQGHRRHVHCDSGNISKMVQDRLDVTTHH